MKSYKELKQKLNMILEIPFKELENKIASKGYRYRDKLKSDNTLRSKILLYKFNRLKNGGEVITYTFNNIIKINSFLGEEGFTDKPITDHKKKNWGFRREQ